VPDEEKGEQHAAAGPSAEQPRGEARARSLRLAKRKEKERKRTGAVVVIVIAVVIALLTVVYFECIKSTPGPSSDVTKGIKLGPVAAGKYGDDVTKGYSKRGFVKVRVRVSVIYGKIESIDVLSHRHLWPKARQATKEIPQRIMDKQRTDVDAVSGATLSSRAIMLAVQDALNNNQKKNKWDVYEKTGEGGRMEYEY
jgi:uncharacterized protein with FMN-binding domain